MKNRGEEKEEWEEEKKEEEQREEEVKGGGWRRRKRRRINTEGRKEKGRIKEKDDKKMWRCCVYTCIPFQFLDQQILGMTDKSAGSNKNVIPNAHPYHCQSCN